MNFNQQKAQRETTEGVFEGFGIIDAIPTLAWCARPGGSIEFLNRRWHDYTGLSVQA
jgi:hypothetical protein